MSGHAEVISTKAVLAGAEPQLFVTDIKSSCDFFTSKLGFTVAFTYGAPPFYAQVMRDEARLNLRHIDRPVIDGTVRDREALFAEFQTAGVTFFQTLKREPWGAKDFIVRDPDGNLLLFAGPAENFE
jgi:catechol 2,3-dioxygenase-like lactoylglutathione lyase family enzyme